MGWGGGGWLLMMIGDTMTPFPRLTPFDPVLVFLCYLASNSMLQFSMFPYSMLPSSITEFWELPALISTILH